MLKPVTASKAAATAKWNQSTPKDKRYHGTAVRVRIKVPIRNELVVQLIRWVGIRKIKGKEFVRPMREQLACQRIIATGDREPRLLLSTYERRRNAQVNFCALTLWVGQSFSFTVRPVSVSFDVEGQRTSKLLRPVPILGFGRRGGSKRNRVAI